MQGVVAARGETEKRAGLSRGLEMPGRADFPFRIALFLYSAQLLYINKYMHIYASCEYFLNLSMCIHVDSSRLYLYRDRKKVFRGSRLRFLVSPKTETFRGSVGEDHTSVLPLLAPGMFLRKKRTKKSLGYFS